MQDNGSKASVDRARSRSKGILLKLDAGFRVLLAREQAWIAEHEDRRVPRTNLMRDLMRAELSRRAQQRGEAIPHAEPANFDTAGEDDEPEEQDDGPDCVDGVHQAHCRKFEAPTAPEPPPAPPQPSQDAPQALPEPSARPEPPQPPQIAAQAANRAQAAESPPEVDPRAVIRADRLKRIAAAVQALKEKDIKKEPQPTERVKATPAALVTVGTAEGKSGFVGDIKMVGVKRGE